MTGQATPDRTVLKISGADTTDFLQGLVTNDIGRADNGLIYAALLSPQGKYLADFFLARDPLPQHGDASILLDVKTEFAAALARRLAMYRLRAKVAIEATDIAVTRGLGSQPAGALADPRHPTLGWRHYGETPSALSTIDWDALRVAHVIPETGIELIPDESYILEAGFDRLHGVDFRKGCYVGQEVTARMKHKTELRKGLVQVVVEGAAPVNTPITTADGKDAGALYTQSGGRGIAYLRFDRARGPMRAGSASVNWKG
jgi:tRNA-modifying protein YgfZ